MEPLAPATQPRVIEHTARLKVDGVRLDLYLCGVFAAVSRSTVQRATCPAPSGNVPAASSRRSC